jgi:ubiquinone/menaquinone biosynthesis C-methylase UbiE
MTKIEEVANPEFVHNQYRTTANLEARIRLHQQFSTNPYGWQHWVFDQLHLPAGSRVLELGCGPGNLWSDNIDRFPGNLSIILSDMSPAMMQTAKNKLHENDLFHFGYFDAQAIPFEAQHFDVVIANHMLPHIPDLNVVLSEIQRVMKPGAHLYASTMGRKHLQEIAVLLRKFDPALSSWSEKPLGSFTLENGAELLAPWFNQITLHRYEDAFLVTQAQPLVDYILSGRLKLPPEKLHEFTSFVQREFEQCGGVFHITKDFGLLSGVR